MLEALIILSTRIVWAAFIVANATVTLLYILCSCGWQEACEYQRNDELVGAGQS